MNKKIIYLSVFLVLTLFLVSACQEPISKQSGGRGDVIQKKVQYNCWTSGGSYSGICGTKGEMGVVSCGKAVERCIDGGGSFGIGIRPL